MPSTTISDFTAADARDHGGPGLGIYVAFVPWALFTLVAQHSTLKWAAIAALVVATAIALPSLLKGRPKLLEVGAVLTFAGFTMVALNDPGASEWVTRYARAIAAAMLAVIAFGSLLIVPFTEQYARESVPREFWSSPQFKEINRRLTAMWALVFAVMVPTHVIAGAIDTHRANLIFNWAIPIVLIVWAAKRTAKVSAAAGREA
ncbi:MAG: hypothetical protein JO168_14400 [Solirubrobacterales bacterium]|nr:hypothetical protein [Solirubrobacterales bacterium]